MTSIRPPAIQQPAMGFLQQAYPQAPYQQQQQQPAMAQGGPQQFGESNQVPNSLPWPYLTSSLSNGSSPTDRARCSNGWDAVQHASWLARHPWVCGDGVWAGQPEDEL